MHIQCRHAAFCLVLGTVGEKEKKARLDARPHKHKPRHVIISSHARRTDRAQLATHASLTTERSRWDNGKDFFAYLVSYCSRRRQLVWLGLAFDTFHNLKEVHCWQTCTFYNSTRSFLLLLRVLCLFVGLVLFGALKSLSSQERQGRGGKRTRN